MQVRFLSAAFYITLFYKCRKNDDPLDTVRLLDIKGVCKRAFCLYRKGIEMQKDKLSKIRDFIVKNCKIVFPIIVVAVVAFTFSVALNWNHDKSQNNNLPGGGSSETETGDTGETASPQPEEVLLVENEDSEIAELIQTYFDARETGDKAVLSDLFDVILTEDLQRYEEWSRYIDHYSDRQIYTKQGLLPGSVIAYVYYKVCFVNREEGVPGSENIYICRDDEGKLYIKSFNSSLDFSEEENAYINILNDQDDVTDFNNRVTVEFQNLVMDNPELLSYLTEVGQIVQESVGLSLADQNATGGNDDNPGGTEDNPEGSQPTETEVPPVDTTPEYATATAKVNVRKSDSEKAEKLGTVSKGTQVKVQEVRVNGWTKVLYEGKDGFIKSDYLQFAESVSGQQVIGTVTATTNVNIRAAASQSAGKLGTLVGGASLDLLAVEDDWCKVVFAGQVAYVKAEYVKQNLN